MKGFKKTNNTKFWFRHDFYYSYESYFCTLSLVLCTFFRWQALSFFFCSISVECIKHGLTLISHPFKNVYAIIYGFLAPENIADKKGHRSFVGTNFYYL